MQLLTSNRGNCILNGSWIYILPRFSRASFTSLKIAVVKEEYTECSSAMAATVTMCSLVRHSLQWFPWRSFTTD